jgi:hypothetical protein
VGRERKAIGFGTLEKKSVVRRKNESWGRGEREDFK